jgi:hypothetical protein
MSYGILVCSKVMQASKADDLKGLTRRHRGTQNNILSKRRPVLFSSAERVATLGLGLRAISR